MRTFIPDRGDLMELNYQPSAGREIDKRRPTIVLSPKAYNRERGLCLAVPLTTDLPPGPQWIEMPPGFVFRPSLILCDYVKSFDFRERNAVYIARVPDALVREIVAMILDVIDPI